MFLIVKISGNKMLYLCVRVHTAILGKQHHIGRYPEQHRKHPWVRRSKIITVQQLNLCTLKPAGFQFLSTLTSCEAFGKLLFLCICLIFDKMWIIIVPT